MVLSPAQRRAALFPAHPLLVLAGPGSGKTRVLVHRLHHLVSALGTDPARILMFTFTVKAAREIRERAARLLGPGPAAQVHIGTFHATALTILRQESSRLGLRKDFSVLGEADALLLIERAIARTQVSGRVRRRVSVDGVRETIAWAKNKMLSPEDFSTVVARIADPGVRGDMAVRQAVYRQYEALKAEMHALDFDDLILKCVEVFRSDKAVSRRYGRVYDAVLVDEFQDTNPAQYAFIKTLAAHRNITVVGDPNQSIYGWRCADPHIFDTFRTDYKAAQTIIDTNYRSSSQIIRFSNLVLQQVGKDGFAPAPPALQSEAARTLSTNLPDEGFFEGPRVFFKRFGDVHEEVHWVVREIKALVQSSGGRLRLQDCAVLYRTKAMLPVIKQIFKHHKVPVTVKDERTLSERPEVRDIVSFLRIVHDPQDFLAFERVARMAEMPPRYVEEVLSRAAATQGDPLEVLSASYRTGFKGFPKVKDLNRESMRGIVELLNALQRQREAPVGETINLVLSRFNYEGLLRRRHPENFDRRFGNVRRLCDAVAESGDKVTGSGGASLDLGTFLDNMVFILDDKRQEAKPETKDAVNLGTLHASKGLEFPVVFIVHCVDGIIPHKKAEDQEAAEEEKRLFYVGCTRAKSILYLTQPKTVDAEEGNKEEYKISPFVGSIIVEESTAIELRVSPSQARPNWDRLLDPPPPPMEQETPEEKVKKPKAATKKRLRVLIDDDDSDSSSSSEEDKKTHRKGTQTSRTPKGGEKQSRISDFFEPAKKKQRTKKHSGRL